MSQTLVTPAAGSDLTAAFRAAYEHRYTWDPGFAGYCGLCSWEQDGRRVEGRFTLGADLKATVEGIEDPEVHKAVASQLWEVAIHRVRRPFTQTHGENTFTAGETDAVGTEVIVGGKNVGDRYRIKDNVVTMVHRHIHGTVVTIFTTSVTETGQGYLSHTYSSRYSDPATGAPRGGESRFEDTFTPLLEDGPWVLAERRIVTTAPDGGNSTQVFRFEDLQPLAPSPA
ncbi:MAG: hypothetical protein RLZZ117_2057 [Cyanobacteriota bacterium]